MATATPHQLAQQIKNRSVTTAFEVVNDAEHGLKDKVVEMTYHGVDRQLVFKYIRVNAQGGVYLGCVEHQRGTVQDELFKNFSLGKVEDFDIGAWVAALRILYDWPHAA